MSDASSGAAPVAPTPSTVKETPEQAARRYNNTEVAQYLAQIGQLLRRHRIARAQCSTEAQRIADEKARLAAEAELLAKENSKDARRKK